MERKEFLKEIQACRRRLNQASFFKMLIFALSVGAALGILFQAAAFLTPFYYANHYTGAAILLAVPAALFAAYIRRSTLSQAALTMDSFGFQERIVTAYEHLEEEGRLLQLQREDAMRQLHAHKDRIQIPILPPLKKLAMLLGLFLILFGMIITPAKTKEQAKELQLIREDAREKEKEIQEVVEGLEELKQQEAMTPQQLAALQEMIESMQSSMTEYQQATSGEMLATANEKLDYKYEDMSSQLAALAASLESGAATSATTAESMQAMSEKLQEMSGTQSLASNQAGDGGQNGGKKSQSGNSQNGQNSGQNGQSGDGQSGQNNGGNGQSQSGSSESGNGQGNGENGQGNNGEGSGSGSGSGEGSGSGSGSGEGSGSGSGSGEGSGSGSGSGEGSGSGSGSGEGSGSGSGSGEGNGDGSGGGRGEGSSSAMHDYVSIPNAVIDEGNLTGNAQNHDNSEFFRTQNGLSWEGTHVSHDEVIGEYEQNAYEGIAAGQYPSGMENVIKDYFASFN